MFMEVTPLTEMLTAIKLRAPIARSLSLFMAVGERQALLTIK